METAQEKKYIPKKEASDFIFGLCGQNMVYSLIGASFFYLFYDGYCIVSGGNRICSADCDEGVGRCQ